MKTNTFRYLSLAGFALFAIAVGSPALAQDEDAYERAGGPYWVYPGYRLVVVRPVFAPPPAWVVSPGPVYSAPPPIYDAPPPIYDAPAPVYYAAPAPVYYYTPPAATTLGAAIAAGSVIGAVVGSALAR